MRLEEEAQGSGGARQELTWSSSETDRWTPSSSSSSRLRPASSVSFERSTSLNGGGGGGVKG